MQIGACVISDGRTRMQCYNAALLIMLEHNGQYVKFETWGYSVWNSKITCKIPN